MDREIPFVRTPPSRFDNLPDFPYQPHFLEHGSLRMAYIDEKASDNGNGQEEVFLCLHGQPTWSFLYRRMIPIFLNYSTRGRGSQPSRRVIAPDLFGFGRSDKPTREADYTFSAHRRSLLHFVETLDLQNITLVVQDWGGLLGLTLPIAFPWRFKRIIVMNTSLAVGTVPSDGFRQWRTYNNRTPDMDIGALMQRACPHLTKAEADAYNAPYPDKKSKAGVRRFPNLVMTDPGMDGVDISKASAHMYATSDQWKTEDIFMACGLKDPVLGEPVMKSLARMWRNGCYYVNVQEAGHFTQEWGGEIARRAIAVFEQQADRADATIIHLTAAKI
ncbi:hypothetical protein B0A50_03260 [Salinomyces thailandicus]|uniref:AB hydrolase-1 domain-containing protein n=1 Tax=Salinomyces thailandicus TaxID=706561 RepID=A0A4U0U625_9PEZI|nr:hypothetical protein B0A50_03260 [Salinomyces thailandica]